MQQNTFLNDILLAGKTKNWRKDWQKRKPLWAYQPPKSLLLLKENLTALDGLTSETKLGQVKYSLKVFFFKKCDVFVKSLKEICIANKAKTTKDGVWQENLLTR